MATVKDRNSVLPSDVFHGRFCVIPNGYEGSKQFGCLSRFDISVGISHKKKNCWVTLGHQPVCPETRRFQITWAVKTGSKGIQFIGTHMREQTEPLLKKSVTLA